jgi:hypothetical protein
VSGLNKKSNKENPARSVGRNDYYCLTVKLKQLCFSAISENYKQPNITWMENKVTKSRFGAILTEKCIFEVQHIASNSSDKTCHTYNCKAL